jgi:hypothetical protein
MRTSGLIVLLVVATLSAACQAQPAPAADPPFRPTSTIRELMQSMVAPSAQGLWDSVGRVSDARGTRDLAPKSTEEWAAVRRHAVSLMESTNLLLIRGRHVAREGQQTLKADDAEPGSELPPSEIEKRINENWAAWTAMAHTLLVSAATGPVAGVCGAVTTSWSRGRAPLNPHRPRSSVQRDDPAHEGLK